MPLPSRSALRILVTVLAGGLLLTTFIILACGPSAPAGQEATPAPEPTATLPWLGTPPTESELATLEALPTATPYPADYVKPTEAPYVPPLTDAEISATFAAEMATEAAEQPRGVAAPANTPTPTPTPLPLTEQVTQFAREKQGEYDVVARVRAGASRVVTIPDGIVWPHNQEPHFEGVPGYDKLVRTKITAIAVYYGTLPDGYELISYPGIPNGALDPGLEYVLFVGKDFVKDSEYPKDIPGKFRYNQSQIKAIGGEGGVILGHQVWVVDNGKALPLSVGYIIDGPAGSDLSAAKAGGESLPLAELRAAIRKGLPE